MEFWRFENTAQSAGVTETSEATLYIYGDICTYDWGEWNSPDDVVPNKFKDELKNLGNVNTIHVRINSGGGSVFGAYAIMNLLKTHKAKIISYIDGIAASAATLVAMAGDKIIASLGSIVMVHLPSTFVWGNVNDLQKAIDILKTITESMIDIYHAKTGIEKDALRDLLNNDEWMTGAQAFEKKFVDEVADFEVKAYLSEDKATAFFNSVSVQMEKIHNKDALAAMLPIKNKPILPEKRQPQEEEIIMSLAELKAKHPEVYTAAVNEGAAQSTSEDAIKQAKDEAIKAERERIKAIDDMALPGMEKLTNRAKFESGITAEQYAVQILMAQKEKGINYLSMANEDAKDIDDVPSAGAPQDGSEASEEDEVLAHLAKENERSGASGNSK